MIGLNAIGPSAGQGLPESGASTGRQGVGAGPGVPQDAANTQRQDSLSELDSLTEEERRVVQQLQQRDREVRQHEQAHMSVAGPYARGRASFTYTTGPDGKKYATGGEVSIDVSEAQTPEATIRKMQVVKRAAMAPAKPSPQDRAVYAEASQTEQEARVEAADERREEAEAQGPQEAQGPETGEGPSEGDGVEAENALGPKEGVGGRATPGKAPSGYAEAGGDFAEGLIDFLV